jgi:ADP-ribosylglycohydrolase
MKKKAEMIKSVVIGHAVADALGVPVEFCTRTDLEKSPVTDMMGYGTYAVPAGAWSDDTSMSIAALDVLADGEIRYQEIMENFVKWCDLNEYTPTGEMFDIGGTCRRAIQNFTWGETPLACGLTGQYENGNGSLMRIHPFVLMAYFCGTLRDVWETFVTNASSLTHAHERSVLDCKIYALVLFALMDAPSKQSIREALETAKNRYADSPEYATYERLFSAHFPDISVNAIKSSGYVVDTLEAALWCLLNTDSYESCVLKAVNLGGDTDTVAAVAGGLAGALYGYKAIPRNWRKTLIKRKYIEEMCDRAAKNW